MYGTPLSVRIQPFTGAIVNLKTHLSPIARAVLSLLIRMPFQEHFYHVFMDNLFNNIPLLAILRHYGIAVTGTVRSSSRWWPWQGAQFKSGVGKTINLNRKSTRFPFESMMCRALYNVAAPLWQDRNLVQILTTGCDPRVILKRERRRPKGTNGYIIAHVRDKWTEPVEMKDVPCYCALYNDSMGGVDIHDQLRCYCSTQQKSFKPWHPLFYFLLDAAVINAYILCRDHFKALGCKDANLIEQRSFRSTLAWNLMDKGAAELDVIRAAETAANPPPPEPPRSAGGRFATGNAHNRDCPRPRRHQMKKGDRLPANVPRFDLSFVHARKTTLVKLQKCYLCKWTRTACSFKWWPLDKSNEHTTRKTCEGCGPNFALCDSCHFDWHNYIDIKAHRLTQKPRTATPPPPTTSATSPEPQSTLAQLPAHSAAQTPCPSSRLPPLWSHSNSDSPDIPLATPQAQTPLPSFHHLLSQLAQSSETPGNAGQPSSPFSSPLLRRWQ